MGDFEMLGGSMQMYQVNFHHLRSSEHAQITKNKSAAT